MFRNHEFNLFAKYFCNAWNIRKSSSCVLLLSYYYKCLQLSATLHQTRKDFFEKKHSFVYM